MGSLLFEVLEQGSRYTTRLVADAERAEAEFDATGLATPRLAQVIAELEQGRARLDDLKDIGIHLWDALFHGHVETLFENAREAAARSGAESSIRLSLPTRFDALPWEALYDERRLGFVAIHPAFSISRVTSNLQPPRVRERAPGPFSVLAVIPQGSGLDVDREWNNLRLAVGKLGDSAVRLERLDGRVTPERLGEALHSQQWDVIHYVGHGEADGDGRVRIRMNGDGSEVEYQMEAEPFASLFLASPPRLVLLNCCFGGLPDPNRTLGGLGPYLRRAGVPAVVAMRYEIQDDVAIKLSDAFYRELLTGATPGRVDVALRHARHQVHLSQRETTVRGFITPILHLAPGFEALFDLHVQRSAPAIASPRPAPGEADDRVPQELLHAVRDHQCLIVLGTVPAAAVRSASGNQPPPPPGPRELALKLATDSEFPLMSEFDPAANPDRWMSSFLLPAVCQHYQRKRKRLRLVQAIQQFYSLCQPPEPMISIASWDAPGIICTHFDGLMEHAFKNVRRPPRFVPSLEEAVDIAEGESLLIQLRGTVRAERTLILTEEDQDRLWEVLGRLPNQIVALAKGAGRSVLFLGVSPRDPVVRRLSKQLLETGESRLQGPTYFACEDHTTVDDAYWDKYDIKWLPLPSDEVVQSLTRALARPA